MTSIALCIIRPETLHEGRARYFIDLKDKRIEVEIQDTRGKEMVDSLDPSYFKGADAAIIVFDLTALDSFYAVSRWNNDLNHADRELSKLLIGNKADLEAQRMVSRAEAEELAQQIGAFYFETSIAIETLPFGRLQVRGGRGIFKALRILVEDLITEK